MKTRLRHASWEQTTQPLLSQQGAWLSLCSGHTSNFIISNNQQSLQAAPSPSPRARDQEVDGKEKEMERKPIDHDTSKSYQVPQMSKTKQTVCLAHPWVTKPVRTHRVGGGVLGSVTLGQLSGFYFLAWVLVTRKLALQQCTTLHVFTIRTGLPLKGRSARKGV